MRQWLLGALSSEHRSVKRAQAQSYVRMIGAMIVHQMVMSVAQIHSVSVAQPS